MNAIFLLIIRTTYFDEIEYLRIESEIVNLQAVSIQRIIKIETITK